MPDSPTETLHQKRELLVVVVACTAYADLVGPVFTLLEATAAILGTTYRCEWITLIHLRGPDSERCENHRRLLGVGVACLLNMSATNLGGKLVRLALPRDAGRSSS